MSELFKDSRSENVEKLISELADANLMVRIQAVNTLGTLRDKRAVEPLVELLRSEQSPEAYMSLHFVVRTLGRIGDKKATKPLIEFFSSDQPFVRREVIAEAFGEIGDQEATEILIDSLKASSHWLRQEAAKSLGQIGATRATGQLLQLLKSDEDENTTCVIAITLCQFQDANLLPDLKRFYNSIKRKKDASIIRNIAITAIENFFRDFIQR